MAKLELKAGDKIVFGRCKKNKSLLDVVVGKVYAVFSDSVTGLGPGEGYLYIEDEAGDWRYLGTAAGGIEFGRPTKIIE